MSLIDFLGETKENNNLFTKEVVKYFMDFLETDFHRRKLPKRNIKFRNNDNLLIGLNLKKYPTFNKKIFQLIANSFDENVINNIAKGVYKTNLPKNLLDLVKLQISKIKNSQINSVCKSISVEIENIATLNSKEYDIALTNSVESASVIIRNQIVKPFIVDIGKPLQNLELGDEDNIYLIEEELVSVLVKQLENKISEIINLFLANEKLNIMKEIQSIFEISNVKITLESFFENLQIADLFLEMFEMERNKNILDKQDFYLYFGDISYKNNKYPLFYIPLNIVRKGDVLEIQFDAQVYVNKKALEYISQEYNEEKGTKGNIKTISERIIYLSQHKNDFLSIINNITNEIIHFFELNENIDFTSEENQISKGASVRLSNNCYFCLFDKSDEALVNDYEDILQQLNEEGEISNIFDTLIQDFIHNNPVSVNEEVDDEWHNSETTEKLVYSSPIPLNSEQRQILMALKKENCKYIAVEGPPGTGKSHTITAIIFDAILKNQSVLILSDKKEALDVVEDKITQTMNKVRNDDNFQNPILRLGKTGNTYGSILSKNTLENIRTHYRAVKNINNNIEESIEKSVNTLKEDIEAEIVSYGDINIKEIQEYFELELYFYEKDLVFDLDELLHESEAVIEMGDIRITLEEIEQIINSDDFNYIFNLAKIDKEKLNNISDYESLLSFLNIVVDSVNKIKSIFGLKVESLKKFSKFEDKDREKLRKYINQYKDLKTWLVGFLFTKKKIAELDITFIKDFIHFESNNPHQTLDDLSNISEIYDFANELARDLKNGNYEEFDYIAFIHQLIVNEDIYNKLKLLDPLSKDLEYIKNIIQKYPLTSSKIGIVNESITTIVTNKLDEISENEFNKQIRYLNLRQKIDEDFSKIPELNYASKMKEIEELVTTQVTFLLDGRLIDFYNNKKGDAETLRNIIKNKQRFPKDEFNKLKEAFPCILSGIRDYAEYIPLEAGMFDLLIIDEASQVSIAQAFPALLRAKKVLILGDKKQFSNVKASQARSDTNREYLHSLESNFRNNVSSDISKITRLKKFDIKTSILDFFNFINNYTIQLLKYFRGYKEIISYSNKFFYQDSLQVMKIRGKSISNVLKFSYVEPTQDDELYPNTNQKEVEFIASELLKLKEGDRKTSVGIITPHTNQQKLLIDKLSKMPEYDYFVEKLHLKIMTFDTCQGEERDIIYYSMVASNHSDKLWGVFIKNLNDVDIEEDGQIKAQRLNVGFSRAKECMHFVLSKKLENYNGSIGEALRYYNYILEEAKKERDITEVDHNSKMEPVVMNWFYQTKFWNENKDNLDFIPQFEIGKYLKQLDKNYTHPDYKVDFLLVYKDEKHKEHKIVIEYDGFREHFKDADEVNEFNYSSYYSDGDVYRQKVLENYGYKFLRINKFNSGENPIETLDKRIDNILKNKIVVNPILNNIHKTVEGLQNGDMKECPKCKSVKSLKDFKDKNLTTGFGRFCMSCKGRKNYNIGNVINETLFTDSCPNCGSSMILRKSRYGRFYGCSRYPYCRGVRKV